VREAGGSVAFPDIDCDGLAASLDLGMRSRVVGARDESTLRKVVAALP